jgi:hypothetical protein
LAPSDSHVHPGRPRCERRCGLPCSMFGRASPEDPIHQPGLIEIAAKDRLERERPSLFVMLDHVEYRIVILRASMIPNTMSASLKNHSVKRLAVACRNGAGRSFEVGLASVLTDSPLRPAAPAENEKSRNSLGTRPFPVKALMSKYRSFRATKPFFPLRFAFEHAVLMLRFLRSRRAAPRGPDAGELLLGAARGGREAIHGALTQRTALPQDGFGLAPAGPRHARAPC